MIGRPRRLGVQPLGDLVAVIEQATGIDVAVLDAGPDEHGLSMRDPKSGRCYIGVARTRNPMRQRSTLAHEVAHIDFEDWRVGAADWGARSPAEIRADAFARHLLVPQDGLRAFVEARADGAAESVLSAVVQGFLVSPPIAAIALCEAGYIDPALKADWMRLTAPHLAARFGWSDQYRALQADSDQRRAPQRLLARAIRGYAEGVLSVQAIATLRGIPADQTEAELRQAGVTPGERPAVWLDAAELPDAGVDSRPGGRWGRSRS